MPKFTANTLPSKPNQRYIPFVPRTGIVVASLTLLLLSSIAGGFELRPAVHPYLSADVIVVLKPSVDHALNAASSESRGVSGSVVTVERGYLDRPIVVPPGVMASKLREGASVKLLLKRSPDGQSYYLIGVFPADYVHGEKR